MRAVLLAVALLLLANFSFAPVASAAGVVTVCDETHLRSALSGGGTVRFACSGVIVLSAEIVIAADTAIDGGMQNVTISGGGVVRVFTVTPGTAFSLRRITVADGRALKGGGIFVPDCYVACGDTTLVIDDSIFTHNHATRWGGGLFLSTYCQEECGRVAVAVSNSVFDANTAGSAGAAIFHDSDSYPQQIALTISDSGFENNTGDVIVPGNSARMTVQNSVFSNNAGNAIIAALYSFTFTSVSGSVFAGNSGNGLTSREWGAAQVNDSGFYSNGGCGISNWDSQLSVRDSTFANNGECGIESGDDGGVATIIGSTFSNNGDAGRDIVSGVQGVVTVANSTLVNRGGSNIGGLSAGYESVVHVINSTLYGVPVISYLPESTIVFTNTIAANSSTGVNCTGLIVDGGGNISYPDATCPGINADPLLGALGNYGGSTQTMVPSWDSPAVDGAVDSACLTAPISGLDQRWMMRPIGVHCDIGAVEFASVLPWRKWLPVMLMRNE